MNEISELKYILNCGKVKKEYCRSNLLNYLKQVENTNKELEIWHDEHIQKFKIDIEGSRREKHIFLTPGTIFGSNGEGYIRFSLCIKEENILEAIKIKSPKMAHKAMLELLEKSMQIIKK